MRLNGWLWVFLDLIFQILSEDSAPFAVFTLFLFPVLEILFLCSVALHFVVPLVCRSILHQVLCTALLYKALGFDLDFSL